MSETALDVHNLTVSYNNKPVLWSVDFEIPTGKLVGILGPNGAGKSTLLKAILGLTDVASGYVRVFNTTVKESRQRISYVPQKESVDWNFPTSVFDVVLMGRYGKIGLFRRPTKADKEMAMASLKDVGMDQFANRQISQLSGGQQQRVFLARALAQNADIYFMDEPFAGVDAATEKTIMELLKKMRDNGKTVIVVHHDLQTVKTYFDWVILLNQRLVSHGPIEECFTEENLKTTYGGKLTILNQVGDLLQR